MGQSVTKNTALPNNTLLLYQNERNRGLSAMYMIRPFLDSWTPKIKLLFIFFFIRCPINPDIWEAEFLNIPTFQPFGKRGYSFFSSFRLK